MALKEFVVTQLDDEWAWVRCPRKDCKGEFCVHRERWKGQEPQIVTRACTYCFRVSLLPGKAKDRQAVQRALQRGR
jgi:hypothetical protein